MNRIFRGGAIVAALVLCGVSSEASAQERVSYYSSPGYAGEGMPYRDCSLDTADDALDGELSTAPARRLDVTTATGLTVEEAEALRAEMRRTLEDLARQYREALERVPPGHASRPQRMFQLAETLRELSDTEYLSVRDQFNECIENWYRCTSDTECYEPRPDYTEAIGFYTTIAQSHPDYDRLDEVIYRLGETLMENDQPARAVEYLSRLINAYQQSEYIPDAHLMMAEHFFESDLLLVARQNYESVLNFPQSTIYNYAIYKIGWVDINDGQWEDALVRFQTVVQNLENDPTDALDFRVQALNDMLLAYAEVDRGWQRARDYYLAVEDEDFMRRRLAQLANLYDDRGMDESRIEVLAYFMENWPNDSRVPQWAEETLDSLVKIGNWNRTEAQAREFINLLDGTGRWAMQNQGNDRELRMARMNAEAWLLMIITRNDAEGRRLTDVAIKQELFRKVRDDYEEFFRRFPDSNDAYEQRFYFAETLYYQMASEGDCASRDAIFGPDECDRFLREAGDQFRAVVEMQPDPEAAHAHDSALGALQVYDVFMSRTNPAVDRDLPAPGEYDQFFGEPTELNEDAQNYVEIVGWFSELYPEDEQIPAASWRAASLYLYASQISEAAERFETIIEHHPNHRFAQQAALAAFVCYNHVEDWVKIESVARRLLTACAGDSTICETASLQSAIAYAMNNQAIDLEAEGDRLRIDGDPRAALEQYVLAADKRVELYREFPESDFSPVALMNAAATYERARQVRTSISLYNEFLESYPESDLVPEARYTLGLIHESQANFDEAATWFESLADFPEYESYADALVNAGRLREALSQFDEAIDLYEQYLALGLQDDTTREIYFQIANIERERDNPDGAVDRLQAYLDRFTDDAYRRVLATYLQADIRLEQGRSDDALRHFDQVYTLFGRGEAMFTEEDTFAAWSVEPGGNFAPDERNAVLPFVAEAAFRAADVLYERAKAADLSYRAGRWRELEQKLVARGEAIIAAQRAMLAVANLGDAAWALAAATRVGQLQRDFYRELYAIPAPDYDECLDMTNGNYDACDELVDGFDETLFVFGVILEERALGAFLSAREIAVNNGIYNEYTQIVARELNDIDRSFRIGGAQGVTPTSSADPYVSTLYILDLSDKLAAFEDFVPPVPEMDPLDGSAPTLLQPTGGDEGEEALPTGDYGTGM